LNKQQAYNRIAQATIKALKEQAELGKVNELTTEAVYLAIDNAFTQEYAQILEQNQELKTTVEFVAQGENLDKDKMMSLAQQTLTKLKNK
jgi:hypothetical protein